MNTNDVFVKFHSYFKDLLLLDLNFNNYALVRWICSFIMTNDPSTNQKSTRHPTTPPSMDEPTTAKRTSRNDLCVFSRTLPPSNLMQFVENRPADASNLPHPRSGHRAIATESDLWIWGGYYPADETQPERMFKEVYFMQQEDLFTSLSRLFSSCGDITLLFDDGLLKRPPVMVLFRHLLPIRVGKYQEVFDMRERL